MWTNNTNKYIEMKQQKQTKEQSWLYIEKYNKHYGVYYMQ